MVPSEPELQRIQTVYAERDRQVTPPFFDLARLFISSGRDRRISAMLAAAGISTFDDLRALDVGCGHGGWLRTMLRWGAQPANLAGVELVAERADAAASIHPELEIVRGSAESLPFPDDSFGL